MIQAYAETELLLKGGYKLLTHKLSRQERMMICIYGRCSRENKNRYMLVFYPTDMQYSKKVPYPIYYELQVHTPMMTYEPFWRMMDERRISTYSLEVDYGFNRAFIHRLKHNKNMNLSSIDYICEVFRCPVEDVVVHIRKGGCIGEDSSLNVGDG